MPNPFSIPEIVNPAVAVPTVTASTPIALGKKYHYVRLTVRSKLGRDTTKEVVRHPGAVVIVPVLPDGRIVLIKVYRLTVQRWLYECCAGTIERPSTPQGTFLEGEAPALCAARELIEETGYQAGQLRPIHTYLTTPGLTDEVMHAFLATDLKHVGQKLEEDEHILVEAIEPDRVLRMIDEGQIVDAKSMLALLLAHRQGHLTVPANPKA